MSDVRLNVGGKIFSGWESVAVARSMETVSGAFQLEVSDVNPWPIAPGDECTVTVAGEVVVTGYIDKVEVSISGSPTHTFNVSGRDKTADLVDCSAIGVSEFKQQDVLQIAQKLAQPFGVKVSSQGSVGAKFPKFSVQPGDTAWATIERACRARGLLALADGKGGLILTEPSKTRGGTAIAEGQNVLEATGTFDNSDRFSKYLVKAQSAGTDEFNGEAAATVKAEATDEGVKRYRPLLTVAESSSTVEAAKKRAGWEATVRAARAGKLSVKVQGWNKGTGGLWAINELVAVSMPSMRISGDMLVAGVQFEISLTGGTVTTLELVRPDAYAVEPDDSGGGGKIKAKTPYNDLWGDTE
jgi:prophage tail gpP-like protein